MAHVVRCRVIVHGHVQGVFFRDSTRREAATRGVRGWVTNRADGTSVEAVFEGDRMDVEHMLRWVQHGPPRARVDRVDIADEDPRGEHGFHVV